jgi:hypothetical protein
MSMFAFLFEDVMAQYQKVKTSRVRSRRVQVKPKQRCWSSYRKTRTWTYMVTRSIPECGLAHVQRQSHDVSGRFIELFYKMSAMFFCRTGFVFIRDPIT